MASRPWGFKSPSGYNRAVFERKSLLPFNTMATVYIIYSPLLDSFYIGSCNDLNERLLKHNQGKYPISFTTRANDWEVFLKIENLEYKQARMIEAHIKRMKSRTYIRNLSRYPELIVKLQEKY